MTGHLELFGHLTGAYSQSFSWSLKLVRATVLVVYTIASCLSFIKLVVMHNSKNFLIGGENFVVAKDGKLKVKRKKSTIVRTNSLQPSLMIIGQPV